MTRGLREWRKVLPFFQTRDFGERRIASFRDCESGLAFCGLGDLDRGARPWGSASAEADPTRPIGSALVIFPPGASSFIAMKAEPIGQAGCNSKNVESVAATSVKDWRNPRPSVRPLQRTSSGTCSRVWSVPRKVGSLP